MKEIKLPPEDRTFIRSQNAAAIPLLVELYGLTHEQVVDVRKIRLRHAEPMPLRLLRELVEQRKTKPRALEFLYRPSPAALCQREAGGFFGREGGR